MRNTLKATGLLRTLLRLKQPEQIRRLRGKVNWQGNLDEMRTDR